MHLTFFLFIRRSISTGCHPNHVLFNNTCYFHSSINDLKNLSLNGVLKDFRSVADICPLAINFKKSYLLIIENKEQYEFMKNFLEDDKKILLGVKWNIDKHFWYDATTSEEFQSGNGRIIPYLNQLNATIPKYVTKLWCLTLHAKNQQLNWKTDDCTFGTNFINNIVCQYQQAKNCTVVYKLGHCFYETVSKICVREQIPVNITEAEHYGMPCKSYTIATITVKCDDELCQHLNSDVSSPKSNSFVPNFDHLANVAATGLTINLFFEVYSILVLLYMLNLILA